jgi:radical SAM protein with 4Fe4S-binding SPASM domain
LETLVNEGINTFVETNAMLVDDAIVGLSQVGIGKAVKVHYSVSLDGGDHVSHNWMRGSGSFEKTLAGLRLLRNADIPSDIQCVVNRRNWNTLKDLVKLAEDLDVTYLKFAFATPIGRANHFLGQLLIPYGEVEQALTFIMEAIRKYKGNVLLKIPPAMIPPVLQQEFKQIRSNGGCEVQNVTSCSFPLLGVLPDGSVTICAQTKDQGEAYFGNIRNISLDEVWAAQELDKRRKLYLKAELTGICADCIFKYECRGACRAHAFTEFGSFEGPYPICAEIDRQGLFPDIYRSSKQREMRARLSMHK